jgi:1,4-dihydroxy-2-naphthoate polyprenyltransferase
LIFIAIKPAQIAWQRMSKPRPAGPPEGYPIWPRWFSTVCFIHNRVFSNYFVLALIIETVIRTAFPTFWR